MKPKGYDESEAYPIFGKLRKVGKSMHGMLFLSFLINEHSKNQNSEYVMLTKEKIMYFCSMNKSAYYRTKKHLLGKGIISELHDLQSKQVAFKINEEKMNEALGDIS